MKPAGRSLVLFLTLLALAGLTLAQSRRRAGDRASAGAHFDYYLLALSWVPEFCAQPGSAAANPRECGSQRKSVFSVHGLWPQANDGPNPEACTPVRPVPRAVVTSILQWMPSPGLVQHEWSIHGTCSGLSPSEYFSNVMAARSAVQIPVQLTSLDRPETNSPAGIEAEFAASNPSFPKGAFRVACRAGALTEVRACFTKDLKPQACGRSAGECGAASVSIRPPR